MKSKDCFFKVGAHSFHTLEVLLGLLVGAYMHYEWGWRRGECLDLKLSKMALNNLETAPTMKRKAQLAKFDA